MVSRAPIEESRKWAIYSIVNLLFKTYFKLNSISLSKNILKALQASKGDMPELELFPKSHQVTFKYYVGVIQFLEEDYKQVCQSIQNHHKLAIADTMERQKSILPKLGRCVIKRQHATKSKFRVFESAGGHLTRRSTRC